MINVIANIIGSVVVGGAAISVLFRDLFDGTDAAPLDDPKPATLGEWDVVQPASAYSEGSGYLDIDQAVAGTLLFDNYLLSTTTFDEVVGLACKLNVNIGATSVNRVAITFVNSGLTSRRTGINLIDDKIGSNTTSAINNQVTTGFATLTIATDETIAFAVISDTLAGFFHIVSSSWKLTGVYPLQGVETSYKLAIASRVTGATTSIKDLSVANLPGKFSTNLGLATDNLSGSVSASTSYTHEADFVMCFDLDAIPTSGATILDFRYVDSNNHWDIRMPLNGDLILRETTGGTTTVRASAGGSTLAGGELIQVRAVDDNIQVWYNETLAFTYASATEHKTATSGELSLLGTGGAISDLTTFPYTLGTNEQSILNQL